MSNCSFSKTRAHQQGA